MNSPNAMPRSSRRQSKAESAYSHKVQPARKTACEVRYPMYVVTVETLLELTRFEPHQLLMRQGKLLRVESGMEVIFVSHQWCSYQHPDDPKHHQLKCLQAVLQRLKNGELDVENDAVQQVSKNLRPPSFQSGPWCRHHNLDLSTRGRLS